MTKVNIKALQTFSHGNVDAKEGGTYAMNKGDAQELEKAGFCEIVDGGNAEQTQVDTLQQKHQKGDVVTDPDEDDLLGEKAAPATENKMAEAPRNKSAQVKK